MRTGLGGFDHGVVRVRDLDAAQDAWRRMGFATTPRGHHTLGSSNHCMMFGHDYVELLAVTKRRRSTASFSDFLSRAEGLAAFAFAGQEALATAYGRLADVAPVASPARGSRRVRIGRVDLDFVRPEALAALIRGGAPAGRGGSYAAVLRIAVADLGVARDALRAGDVPHEALGEHALAVPASFAQGVAVVLEG